MINAKNAIGLCLSAAVSVACTAQVSPAATGLPMECVGRMVLTLPGETEVATLRLRALKEQIASSAAQRALVFDDGERFDYGQISYTGTTYVSQALTPAEMSDVYAVLKKQVARQKIATRNGEPGDTSPPVFKVLKEDVGDYAWSVAEYHAVVKALGNRVLYWEAAGRQKDLARNQAVFEHVVNGLVARQPQEIPVGPGVCIPFGFIKDDGAAHRSVGMGFRLKQQPDLTIWLEDSSAPDAAARGERATTRYLHDDFWTQYENAPNGQKIESLWTSPSVRSVALGEQGGSASFVRIKRPDGSTDFGYLALAPGKQGGANDTPKLSFYMIQQSSRARAAGKAPLDEKAFLALAQQVATSVRHRPVR